MAGAAHFNRQNRGRLRIRRLMMAKVKEGPAARLVVETLGVFNKELKTGELRVEIANA